MSSSIYDIAKKTGLSVVTVSRVLNNYPSVKEVNREKVLAAMKELNYVPNAAARNLAKGKTGMIGLLMPNYMDAFMIDVMSSVEEALKDRGLFLAISTASDLRALAETGNFIGDRVDGLLIMNPFLDLHFIQELKKREIPMVFLDLHQINVKVPTVTVDNFQGGYDATEVLIKGGAHRIAHITGNNIFESSRERTEGYLQALRDYKMPIDPSLIIEGEFKVSDGYDVTKQWIKSGSIPDAVFAGDDNIAFGVLDAARESGIDVPNTLSIIGFDDHPFTAQLHPSLSTVKQPTEEMGQYGVSLLLDIIDKKLKKISKTVLTPTVIQRDTTLLNGDSYNK